MIQYWISKQSSVRFMRDLYKRFLTEDKDWHFFYEDTYMLLRLKKRSRLVEGYLDSKNVLYTRLVWTDAHPQVRKHQDLFKEIFHAYSVLAMTANKKDFPRYLNRVIHCFCNMNWEGMKKCKMSETTAVATHLIGSAHMDGKYEQQRLDKKKVAKKK